MTKQDNSKPQASVAPSDTAAPSPALGPAPVSGPVIPSAAAHQESVREAKSRDGLVVASIVIASVAIAVMCFSQLVLSLPVSAGVGVVTLALLMLIHKQMQKSAQISQLTAELAQSRQAAKPKPAQRPVQAQPQSASASTEARIRELSRDIGNLAPRSDSAPGGTPSSAAAPSVGPFAIERIPRTLRGPAGPNSEPTSKPADDAKAMPSLASAPTGEVPPQVQGPQIPPRAPEGDAPREQWSFRPRSEAQASVQEASGATGGVNGKAQAPNASVAMTIEGDLELVQRKIKELADEVNAAEALRPKPQLVSAQPKGPQNALEDSIGALRAAAKKMRGRPSLGDFIPKLETQTFEQRQPAPAPRPPVETKAPASGFGELVIPASAERIAGSDSAQPRRESGDRDVAPPSLELPLPDFGLAASPALPPRAAEITRAIADNAIDVQLGPIVTLAEHSVSHYEMVVNLRSSTGEALDFNEDDFAQIGGELDAQFDVARFTRAAALAARMDSRDREGSLLAEFLGSSMTSRAFLETFASTYESRQRISAQLVLTFTQRAVDEFSTAAWQAVRDMHAFGFRFALDKVTHVGTDFAALQRSGFRFVRLDAQVLIDGMTTPERFVPAGEILQRATLAGLSIIAADVREAATQKSLRDAGIQLGQGPLFGAARQVSVGGDSGSGSSSGPSGQSAAA